MLPRIHAWSRTQKWLIIASYAAVAALGGIVVRVYERYYRGPTDGVLVGT
jgi:hypothetical protein